MKAPIRPLMFVHVAKDLGPSMSHFEKDCDAVVKEVSGNDYGLYLLKNGKISNEVWWYHRYQLTVLKKQSIKKVYHLLDLWDDLHEKLDYCENNCNDDYDTYWEMADKVWEEYYERKL